ncbi:hypothetical protein OG547_15810 [Streptomyces longwoodensis]|uniref:hypothetical protein n=1 Tax=Streptomyces longwoodensis TaxID=68231 RepID=UPI002ED41DB9|nr:hypothetical protein OG547_15810 [Streptomyces longwoodensis]
MDEINRMLAEDCGLPKPFRSRVAEMLGDRQITWRKVGMGVRIACAHTGRYALRPPARAS